MSGVAGLTKSRPSKSARLRSGIGVEPVEDDQRPRHERIVAIEVDEVDRVDPADAVGPPTPCVCTRVVTSAVLSYQKTSVVPVLSTLYEVSAVIGVVKAPGARRLNVTVASGVLVASCPAQ